MSLTKRWKIKGEFYPYDWERGSFRVECVGIKARTREESWIITDTRSNRLSEETYRSSMAAKEVCDDWIIVQDMRLLPGLKYESNEYINYTALRRVVNELAHIIDPIDDDQIINEKELDQIMKKLGEWIEAYVEKGKQQ